MTSLYDVPLGSGAVVRPTRHGSLRRVRHGSVSVTIDAVDEVGLVLNLSGSHRVEQRTGGRVRSDVARIGSVSVLPPGCPATVSIIGECRVLQLRLPWPNPIALRPALNADDPALSRLLLIAAAAEAGAVPAALSSIVAHLAARHAAEPSAPVGASGKGGIPAARLRRVLQRMEAALPVAASSSILAAEAGMSPAHFTREFARTTGAPPHRYLVRRRVERAMHLLADRRLSVDEVACRAGFTHASHLARHMRRVAGVTPAAFRAEILP